MKSSASATVVASTQPPPRPPQTPVMFRASFVAELLSVPLLPTRLGVDGINLLLIQRRGLFVDCLRDFRRVMEEEKEKHVSSQAAAAAAGDGATAGAEGGESGGGVQPEYRDILPAPPVSCCSTEAFLVGNLAAVGTKLSLDGGNGGGEGAKAAAGVRAGAREQEEFMRVMTCLLERPQIPESLLTDRQAITWKASRQKGDGGGGGGGTSMMALAVPHAVQDQVRGDGVSKFEEGCSDDFLVGNGC